MTHPADIHVGSRIRQRRLSWNLSQSDLGNACRVKFQQIQKYETGANRVSASRLVEIARALETSPAYFFEGLSDTAPEQEIKTQGEADMLTLFRAAGQDAQQSLLNVARQIIGCTP